MKLQICCLSFFAFFAVFAEVTDKIVDTNSILSNSSNLSDLKLNVSELDIETNENLGVEDDTVNTNRDKRTLGAMFRGVADLFGYDLLRRPSVVKEQRWFPPPLAPLQSERQSATNRPTVLALIPASVITPATPTIHLQLQQAPRTSPQLIFRAEVESQHRAAPSTNVNMNSNMAQPCLQSALGQPCGNGVNIAPINLQNSQAVQPCLQAAQTQPCQNSVSINAQNVQPCLQAAQSQPCNNQASINPQTSQPCFQQPFLQPGLNFATPNAQTAQPCLQASPVQPCGSSIVPQNSHAAQPCIQAPHTQPCLNLVPQNAQAAQPCLYDARANPQQLLQQQQQQHSSDSSSSQDVYSSEFGSFTGRRQEQNPNPNLNVVLNSAPCLNANAAGMGLQPCGNSAGVQPCGNLASGSQLQPGVQFQTGLQLQPGFNLQAGVQFPRSGGQQVQPCLNSESLQPCANVNAAAVQPCLNSAATPCLNQQFPQQPQQIMSLPRSLSETVRRIFSLNFSINRGLGGRTNLVQPPPVYSSLNPMPSPVAMQPCLNAAPVACANSPCSQIRPHFAPQTPYLSNSKPLTNSGLQNQKPARGKISKNYKSHPVTTYAPNYAQNFAPNRFTTKFPQKYIPNFRRRDEPESVEDVASLETPPNSEERARGSYEFEPGRYKSSPKDRNNFSREELRNSLDQFWINNPAKERYGYKYMVTKPPSTITAEKMEERPDRFTSTKRSHPTTPNTNAVTNSQPQSHPEKVSFFKIPSVDDEEFTNIARHTENEIDKNKEQIKMTTYIPEFHKKIKKIEIQNPNNKGLTKIEEHTKKYMVMVEKSKEIVKEPQNKINKWDNVKNKMRKKGKNDALDLSRLQQKGKNKPIPKIKFNSESKLRSDVKPKEKKLDFSNFIPRSQNINSTAQNLKIQESNNKKVSQGRGNVKFHANLKSNHQNLNRLVQRRPINDNNNKPVNRINQIIQNKNSGPNLKVPFNGTLNNFGRTHEQNIPLTNANSNELKKSLESQKEDDDLSRSNAVDDSEVDDVEFAAIARHTSNEVERKNNNQPTSDTKERYENIQVVNPLTNTTVSKKMETVTNKYIEEIEDPVTLTNRESIQDESNEEVVEGTNEENESSYRNQENEMKSKEMSEEHIAMINNITGNDQSKSSEKTAQKNVVDSRKPILIVQNITEVPQHVEIIKVNPVNVRPTVASDIVKNTNNDGKNSKRIKQRHNDNVLKQTKENENPKELEKLIIKQVERNTDFEIMPAAQPKISNDETKLKEMKNLDHFSLDNLEKEIMQYSKDKNKPSNKDPNEFIDWTSKISPISLENYQSFEKSIEAFTKQADFKDWTTTDPYDDKKSYNPRKSIKRRKLISPKTRSNYKFNLMKTPKLSSTKSDENVYDPHQISLEQPRSVEHAKSGEYEPVSYEYTVKFDKESDEHSAADSKINVQSVAYPKTKRNKISLNAAPIVVNSKENTQNNDQIKEFSNKFYEWTPRLSPSKGKIGDVAGFGELSFEDESSHFKNWERFKGPSSGNPYYKYKTIPDDYNVYKPTKEENKPKIEGKTYSSTNQRRKNLKPKNNSNKNKKNITQSGAKENNKSSSKSKGDRTTKSKPKSVSQKQTGYATTQKTSETSNKKRNVRSNTETVNTFTIKETENDFEATAPIPIIFDSKTTETVSSIIIDQSTDHNYKNKKRKTKKVIHGEKTIKRLKRDIDSEEEEIEEAPPVNIPSLGNYNEEEFHKLRNYDVRYIGEPRRRKKPKRRRGGRRKRPRQYYDEEEFVKLRNKPLPNEDEEEDSVDMLSEIKKPKRKPIDYSRFEKFHVEEDLGLSPNAKVKTKESINAYVTTVKY